MTVLVSVVDLSNGMVTDVAASVATVDVPAGLGPGAGAVSLDGIGLLHFGGSDGANALAQARTSPVSERVADEPCFILADPGDRDEHGWQIFRLCVREGATG